VIRVITEYLLDVTERVSYLELNAVFEEIGGYSDPP